MCKRWIWPFFEWERFIEWVVDFFYCYPSEVSVFQSIFARHFIGHQGTQGTTTSLLKTICSVSLFKLAEFGIRGINIRVSEPPRGSYVTTFVDVQESYSGSRSGEGTNLSSGKSYVDEVHEDTHCLPYRRREDTLFKLV